MAADPIHFEDFLKVDIEGSEWPVLFGCSELDRVDRIAAEIHLERIEQWQQHVGSPLSVDSLADGLTACGYSVSIEPSTIDPDNYVFLFATSCRSD